MSLLKRRPPQPHRLLPPDAPRHLAAYGYHSFHSSTDKLGDPELELIGVLQSLGAGPSAADAVAELRVVAIAVGGWAAYGASEAVDAFLPSQSDSEDAAALHDARLVHVHSLDLPDVSAHLSPKDRARYETLYPSHRAH